MLAPSCVYLSLSPIQVAGTTMAFPFGIIVLWTLIETETRAIIRNSICDLFEIRFCSFLYTRVKTIYHSFAAVRQYLAPFANSRKFA